MKNILKNQLKALLAIVLFFGMPGFAPQNSMQTAKLSMPALEAPQVLFEPVAVKVLPASPLGFLQKTYEIQKTEDIFALQQSGGYAIQASIINQSYQLGDVAGVFLKKVIAEDSVPENLQVLPLRIAVKDSIRSSSGSFFEGFSLRTDPAVQEKGLVQVLVFTFRLKTSSVPSTTSGGKSGQRVSSHANTAAEEERFIFRC